MDANENSCHEIETRISPHYFNINSSGTTENKTEQREEGQQRKTDVHRSPNILGASYWTCRSRRGASPPGRSGGQ